MATRNLTKDALAQKKAKGERVGSVPTGFRLADDGKTLEPDAREQEALQLIRELRGLGYSYRQILRELEARGMKPRGRTWHAKTILRACRDANVQPAVSQAAARAGHKRAGKKAARWRHDNSHWEAMAETLSRMMELHADGISPRGIAAALAEEALAVQRFKRRVALEKEALDLVSDLLKSGLSVEQIRAQMMVRGVGNDET